MKVLLVDDEREICALLSAILIRAGIDVGSAYTLAEARRALGHAAYDAVFVDVHLPDGVGYDLIPFIRRHSPGSKVIMISAVDGEGDTALRNGVDLFLPKPFNKRIILDKLHRLLPGPYERNLS